MCGKGLALVAGLAFTPHGVFNEVNAGEEEEREQGQRFESTDMCEMGFS